MVELITEFHVIKGREFNSFLNTPGNNILRLADKNVAFIVLVVDLIMT